MTNLRQELPDRFGMFCSFFVVLRKFRCGSLAHDANETRTGLNRNIGSAGRCWGSTVAPLEVVEIVLELHLERRGAANPVDDYIRAAPGNARDAKARNGHKRPRVRQRDSTVT